MKDIEKLSNRLCLGLLTALFFVFAVLQVRYHFFTIDHISWLSADDGDITYQVDRLLLNAHTPNYTQTSSTVVDYGSELFLLAPVLKIINLFGATNLLNSYYLITFTHLVCGIAAILLLSTFLGKYSLEKILWTFTVLLSPLFGYYIGFAKPDCNIVLLMIVLSLYFCTKKNANLKDIVWAIFFSAFGFAIKWWSLFCLPAIAYSLLQIKEITPEAFRKYAKMGWWCGILSMIPTAWYAVGEIIYTLLKNNIHNYLSTGPHWLLALDLWGISFVIFTFSFYLFKWLIIKSNKVLHALGVFLFQIIIFISSYVLCTIPFVQSGTYLRSIYAQAFGDFRIAKIGTNDRASTSSIVHFWLSEFNDYHFFSPVLLSFLIIAVILFYKRKKNQVLNIDHTTKVLLIFLGSYFLFMLTLLNRNNRAMLAMLYPLCMALPFYLATYFTRSYRKSFILITMSLMQIVYQASSSSSFSGTLPMAYLSRDDLRSRVNSTAEWLEKTFPHVKQFHMCDYAIPQAVSTPFLFNIHWRFYCKDNLKKELNEQKSTDAWIIASSMLKDLLGEHPEVLSTKKITEYSTYFIWNDVHYSIIENK